MKTIITTTNHEVVFVYFEKAFKDSNGEFLYANKKKNLIKLKNFVSSVHFYVEDKNDRLTRVELNPGEVLRMAEEINRINTMITIAEPEE